MLNERNFISEIISYERRETLDAHIIGLHDVSFLQDFGVFNKGRRFEFLCINFRTGYITGDRPKNPNSLLTHIEQKFTLMPVINE